MNLIVVKSRVLRNTTIAM